jgi:para-nitrobenzyl esterase
LSQKEKTVVEIKAGKIEGSYQPGLYIFKGIPYAAPPAGDYRWFPPQPVKHWKGVRRVQNFSAIAPQKATGPAFADFRADDPQSEDCLYLNVWTPGLDDTRRPVLVWIHGGGFNMGSGSQAMYTGKILAQRGDAVIVTINYRLGLPGFLRLNDITGGKIPATGNEGLLDQIAALKWVHDNIAAFGGNPDNITVFGESAGAISIGCLMAMPQARGTFHKAILQSGAASTATPLAAANSLAEQFLNVVGLKAGEIDALQTLGVEQLLSADLELRVRLARVGEKMRVSVSLPVIDGKTLPAMPVEAVKQGSARNVPVLVGTNLDECTLFHLPDPDFLKLDEAGLVERCQSLMPAEQVPKVIAAYRKARAKRGPTSPAELFMAIRTDLMFRIPALRLIEAQQSYQPAYNYLFTWKSPALDGILGACHSLEMGFVFGTHNDSFCGSGPAADRLSSNIQDAWLAFARSGNPSCPGLGTWLPYGKRRVTMLLGEECHLEEAPYEEERRTWY